MGSSFDCKTFDGNLTKDQLYKKFVGYQEDQEYEHGHDIYNGTLSTTNGLEFCDKTFDSEEEASNYVADNTEKWGNSLAVKFKITKTVFLKEPTFSGKLKSETKNTFPKVAALGNAFVLGGRYTGTTWGWWLGTKSIRKLYVDEKLNKYRHYEGDEPYELIPADQLSESNKILIKEACENYINSVENFYCLFCKFENLRKNLGNLEKDFIQTEFDELNKIRLELVILKNLLKENKSKIKELDKKLSEELYSGREIKELDSKWLVGGWCAD